MFPELLPHRVTEYTTELTAPQIGEVLNESVLTGFSLFSPKPYYGGFTSFSFSVRRTHSRLKKQSLSPGVEGAYKDNDGRMHVTIGLHPHPALTGVFLFLFLPLVLFWALAVPDLLRTWNLGDVVGGLFPPLAIYGGFWVVFQVQSGFDARFWENALRLRETPKLSDRLTRS